MANRDSLGEILVDISSRLVDDKAELVRDEQGETELYNDLMFGGVKYGQVFRKSYPLASIKGRGTRSYFHVTITRFGLNDGPQMGLYELVCYCS